MVAQYWTFGIYYGHAFAPVPGRPPADPAYGPFDWIALEDALNRMCRGPYFNGLRQYGFDSIGISQTRVAPFDPPAAWFDGTAEHGFSDADITNFIAGEIAAGRTAAPDDVGVGVAPIYVVYLPRKIFSKDHFIADVGWHGAFSYAGHRCLYTWVMQGESIDDTTKILSHELVEIIASEHGAGEISDACTGYIGVVNDVMVQGYRSRADRDQCIIPGIASLYLQAVNFPNRYIRHRNFLGELTVLAVGQESDFTFRMLTRKRFPGGDQLVSLQSTNYPDRYLRHRDFRIRLEGPVGQRDDRFEIDSSFWLERGLARPDDPNAVSLRAKIDPGDLYLRHRDFDLWIEPESSPNLALDATFIKSVAI